MGSCATCNTDLGEGRWGMATLHFKRDTPTPETPNPIDRSYERCPAGMRGEHAKAGAARAKQFGEARKQRFIYGEE